MKKIYLLIFVLALVLPNNAFTQHNKTVTLTVSGEGNTKQEALQTALRNAIEQAFGAFISSNTKILNNELVKDEIVSISNGNIQDYEIISEIQRKNGLWNSTVKTIVSIDKLTSFSESKGITVEFEGAIFAANVKQQELNKKNEETVVENMSEILKELQDKCFDYEISTSAPIAWQPQKYEKRKKNDPDWQVPVSVHIIPNENLYSISNYFYSTLKGITISKNEIKDYYLKNNVNFFSFVITPARNNAFAIDTIYRNKKRNKIKEIIRKEIIKPDTIYLRNNNSIEIINNFFKYFRKSIMNFQVNNGIYVKLGHELFTNKEGYLNDYKEWPELYVNNFSPCIILSRNEDRVVIKKIFEPGRNGGHSYKILHLKPYVFNDYDIFEVSNQSDYWDNNRSDKINQIRWKHRKLPLISFEGLRIGDNNILKLEFNDFFTTDEISKITKYKIEPRIHELKKELDYSGIRPKYKYSVIKN
ncbi:hypothetical protein [Anaerophaga thermohalophila]|jgi:hypothetical protein|uniref:hypothetical protein n=1 Tax=Anaerophaga thermohalophila TaxID=177400 RepID=UPI00037F61F7|nr:hypothetical protein [Anaerophaga thermohalophila]